MLRRRRWLILLLLLLLAALAGIRTVITFDLNRYRETVQARLTAALGRPVELGQAQLSLRHGIAFTFSELEVAETAEASWSLTAGSLLTKLKVTPLLRGRIEPSEIVLLSPRLRLILRPGTPPAAATLPHWENLEIRRLTIRDGEIVVDDRRDKAPPFQFTLEKVNLRLANLSAGRRTDIDLKGQLLQPAGPARFAVSGQLLPATEDGERAFDLKLDLRQLDTAVLVPHLPLGGLTGSLSLSLHLTGSRTAGLQVEGKVAGKGLRADIPTWYEEPLAIETLQISGRGLFTAAGTQLTGLQVQADGLAAGGQLAWRREGEGLWLEGVLRAPAQPIRELARFLPDRGTTKKKLAGGSWAIEELRFAGLSSDYAAPERLSLQGKFHLRDLDLGQFDPRLGAISLSGRLADHRLELAGTAECLGTSLRVNGTIERPLDAQPQLTMEAEGVFPADRLATQLSPATAGRIRSGAVPLHGTVEGTFADLRYELAGKLNAVNLSWGEPAAKNPPLSGAFSASGRVRPGRLEIGRARLQIGALDLRGRGALTRTGEKPFSLALEFTGLDLEEWRPHFPLLDKIAATGRLDGAGEIAGKSGEVTERTGILRLRGVGARPTAVIAALNNINGRLRLAGDRLDIEELTADLGHSPLAISGSVTGPEHVQADLQVYGKNVRAADLIFSSGQWLREVNGNLRIDRHGIDFAPVSVHLDGGTEATVNGQVAFAPAAVDLDIVARQGNIDEVIALWQKPGPPPGAESTTETVPGTNGHGVKVRIQAKVGEGRFGELLFQQAQGEIVYEQGRLEIFPLRFQVGPGSCQGRVAVQFGAGAPFLQTSGHLENVDAAGIYQQLLKRRGLITGTLHGDFYLEGEVGSNFLQSSIGGFSLETRNGVLRKFAVLGKIFSVLNVSQIFALQLPDMARDGMPFQKLAGNFSLRKGILSSEDLFVESPAMNLSLVGEMNLPKEKIDVVMGIKPLRTVDRIITKIPIAGWILAGEEKALITLHFHIHGHPDRAEVDAVPITSLSEKVFGVFRRVLDLPGKVIDDFGGMVPTN